MAGEVLQPWADAPAGEEWTFVRGKLEAQITALTSGDKSSALSPQALKQLQGGAASVPSFTGKLKKEDVEFISKEMLLTKSEAEKTLAEHDGDMTKALKSLLIPAAEASTS